ncbi:MAG: methyltransferase [Pseudomonadota bacterium]
MKEIPSKLMQFVSGYRASRIVLTAIELDLFSQIGTGATASQITGEIRADERGTAVLLHALTALGLLRKKGGRFFNTPVSAGFLAAGGANDGRLGLKHHLALWESWSALTKVVREGSPGERSMGGMTEEARTAAFIGLMHQTGAIRGPRVAAALRTLPGTRMLDVGGGSGAYSIAILRKNRRLRATLFDRSVVLPLAQRYVAKAGFSDRFTFQAGDLTTDRLGEGFDLVLISSICHMLSPEQNVNLFERARRALVEGGTIVVHDFILENDRTKPVQAALFAVNMLVNTEGGNSYSVADYTSWLRSAGFGKIRFRRLPGGSDLMTAS